MISNLQELLECGDEIYNLYTIIHNEVTCVRQCKKCRIHGRNINKYFDNYNDYTGTVMTSKVHKYLISLDEEVIDALNMVTLIGKV